MKNYIVEEVISDALLKVESPDKEFSVIACYTEGVSVGDVVAIVNGKAIPDKNATIMRKKRVNDLFQRLKKQ